jgi:acetolactate synthase-1/2/3 large subunit
MRLTGGEMVGQCLVEEGVDTIFGIPGGAILPLYEVLHRYPIHHVLCRHEQGGAHMADGYARAAGKPGVCMGTSGPGATNLVTGILNAHMDSAPIVAITANVASHFIGTDAFQEADITGITIPVTKQNYLVRNIKDLPRTFKEAFYVARTGRPGPVHVDIPKDVLVAEYEFDYPDRVSLPGFEPTVEGNMSQIRKAARLIEQAERPVIIAGHGIVLSRAYDELLALAEKAKIPVVTTLLGISCFPESHPLAQQFLGMHGWVWANYAVHNADLVLGLGMRFDDRACGKFSEFAPGAKLVHVEIDPAEIGKNVRCDVPIVGDVKRVLHKLIPQVSECRDHGAWLTQLAEWRHDFPPKKYPANTPELYHQQVIDGIQRVTRGQATIVADVGQHQMFSAQHFIFDRPNTFITSGGLGTMGFSLPAAIGAQLARPTETVWCMVGDGCFQMNSQELAVLIQERLPVKIALFNNRSLGMVRQWQQLFYDGNEQSIFLDNGDPDYVKLAEAYSIPASRCSRPADVEKVVQRAMDFPGPYLIEFVVSRGECVYPMVVPGTALAEVIPDEAYVGGDGGGRTVDAEPNREPVPTAGLRD